MTQTRADFRTGPVLQPVRYSDFTANFDRNPITGSLAKLTNERSVKNALSLLVRTVAGERPFQSGIGSHILDSLFDNLDGVQKAKISNSLMATIAANEPRVVVDNISFAFNPDQNGLAIAIVYHLVNANVTDQLTVILKRSR